MSLSRDALFVSSNNQVMFGLVEKTSTIMRNFNIIHLIFYILLLMALPCTCYIHKVCNLKLFLFLSACIFQVIFTNEHIYSTTSGDQENFVGACHVVHMFCVAFAKQNGKQIQTLENAFAKHSPVTYVCKKASGNLG